MDYKKYKRVPNLLRKYRIASGLKQKEVARKLGLKGTGKIYRWESGESGIVQILFQAANAPWVDSMMRSVIDDIVSCSIVCYTRSSRQGWRRNKQGIGRAYQRELQQTNGGLCCYTNGACGHN